MRCRSVSLFALVSVLFFFLPCVAMAVDYFVPPDMSLSGGDTFTLNAGDTLSVSTDGRVDSSGTITNGGSIVNLGSITNNAGGDVYERQLHT